MAMPRRVRFRLRRLGLINSLAAATVLLSLAGCDNPNRSRVEQLIQRQEQLQLQVQQLEQRLNRPGAGPGLGTGMPGGNLPAGRIKSLTYRSGTSDDRLRIYWADGSISDLPCTKEQNTLACG